MTFSGLLRDTDGKPARRVVLVLLFLVSLPAVTPRLHASDEIEYFAYLRSLWFDGDLSFENEYRYFYDRGIARDHGFRRTFLELETASGLRLNFATVGPALLWSPFYAVGDIAARLLHGAGVDVAVDGFSKPYLLAVTYGSATYAFLAICIAIGTVRRLFGEGHFAGLAVWFGTPVLFYAYLAPGYAHACSAFAVALFVGTWLVVRETWSRRGLMALGACAALMVMVREQDVFFVVGPALDFAWSVVEAFRAGARARFRTLLLRVAVGAATALICYLPQVATYVVLYGHVGPAPEVTRKMVWLAPYTVGVLFSAEHGLLVWTPLVMVAVAGLVGYTVVGAGAVALPRARRIGLCLLAMFAAQVYISGSVESWTTAGSFGARRFVGTTVLLVIGLTGAFRMAQKRLSRAALVVGVVVCIWWNLGLTVQYGAGLMDRRRLEPLRNAHTTFVVLPRLLPDLAYRYLFDRSSFYRDPDRYLESSDPVHGTRGLSEHAYVVLRSRNP